MQEGGPCLSVLPQYRVVLAKTIVLVGLFFYQPSEGQPEGIACGGLGYFRACAALNWGFIDSGGRGLRLTGGV